MGFNLNHSCCVKRGDPTLNVILTFHSLMYRKVMAKLKDMCVKSVDCCVLLGSPFSSSSFLVFLVLS
ncbi:hypothetical protein DsansV1_C24g0180831 [Dioscorea sansibarensis]